MRTSSACGTAGGPGPTPGSLTCHVSPPSSRPTNATSAWSAASAGTSSPSHTPSPPTSAATGTVSASTTPPSAQAAADTLHVAAAMLGSRPLREAAEPTSERPASPSAASPGPRRRATSFRQAARIMAAHARISGDRTNEWAIVIVRLAALAKAVAELRAAQQRASRARAALTAAQQLHRFASRHRPGRQARPAPAMPEARTSPPSPSPARRYRRAARGLRRGATRPRRAPLADRRSPGHADRAGNRGQVRRAVVPRVT